MTAKPLMVQGTMSGVGKSLIAAGLCRIFAQDGLRAAPFKAQNMALNSFICADGSEIGRAQAVQAQAAGILPEAAMNPILLKPTSDVGSQVIVNGRVRATMDARSYFAWKQALVPDIKRAYDDLARRFDVIVIEGAGSPAEVNLKTDDIVNMGMAKLASAPVLLVGDIDRGGVFAQLIGTMMLLDGDERARVKASVVNKFRGDASILEPGLDVLRARMGVPVAGVVPYAPLDIDDEDSLSDRLAAREAAGLVDIAVIRLPRISNFTDFIALDAHDDVSVRYVSHPRELGEPDMVVLPGTKNTLSDLAWLRESGLEAALLKLAAADVVVFGICGGLQMLGEWIDDPDGVEGGGSLRGLGLLPIRTVFSQDKRQVQVSGTLGAVEGPLALLSGVPVAGYEIHMGRTAEQTSPSARSKGGPCSDSPALAKCPLDISRRAELRADSLLAAERTALFGAGNVYGTYLHGFFDEVECSRAVVRCLMERKGLEGEQVVGVDMAAYRESQYDALAQLLRDNLDLSLIYRIVEEGA